MLAKLIGSHVSKSLAICGTIFLLSANPALADVSSDASKLLKNGKHAEALSIVDGALKQNPRDAQMRFLKGVILAEQNKTAEAIGIFTKLTEDYPNLPEPYNNLAVLYAANNQFEKARTALDKAIRTNPSYATAYENLGDVHAKLASQAYDKALQLDSSNTGAKSKLTMVRTLVASSSLPGSSTTVAGTSAAPAPAPTSKPVTPPPVPQPMASADSKAKTPVVSVDSKPKTPVASSHEKPPVVAEAKPAPTKPETKHAPAPNNADHDAVLAVVNQWAKAWSAKDVKAYLGFYGSDFDTPKGMTRKAWAEERQARIVGKGRINVKVESPQVAIKGNTATVKFRQVYESDRLTANSRKTLVLAKQGGRWQIQQEQTGS